jgi:O-antigen/teichoic acid export membrane protein
VANVVLTLGVVFYFLEIQPRIGGNLTFAVKRNIDYVFIANLIGSAVIAFLMLPDMIKVKWHINWEIIRKTIPYAAPLVVVGIAGQINQTFAVPLQKFFLGEGMDENLTQAGAYAGPMKIALLLNLFTVAFNYAAEPFFFNNVGKENAAKAYGQILHAFVLACGFAMMGIVCFQEIAILLIGETYRGPQDIIPILLFSNLFLGIYYNISIWYKLSDRTIFGAYISLGGALITLTLSIVLLPQLGYIVSAYASLACYAFMMMAGYLLGQKYYPIKYPVKAIIKILLFYFFFVIGTILLKSFVSSDGMALLVGIAIFALFLLILYKWQKPAIVEFLAPHV